MNPRNQTTPNLLPIDDLDKAIVGLSARINAATYELLVLIRQFDERAGWLRCGLENCAEWLHWRCDLSMNAAHEKVRVAHAIKTLPVMSDAFSQGELSYSKVRAMTRVVGPHNEEEFVVFALQTTTARVEERCRELRYGDSKSTESANRVFVNRSLRVTRNAEKGTMTITAELPIEMGELVEKAVDKARDDSLANVEFVDESWSARQADALVEIANAFLSPKTNSAEAHSDQYLVTVHVDESALSGGTGRSSLPIESVKRMCCDAKAVVLVENDDGTPLSVGRKSRTVPTAIKRALQARDKGCTFPGCRHERFVDAHHVRHWSAGGETSLDNLMLLCSRHHKLVHEGGFSIERDYQNRWFFQRPDGRAVPECGYSLLDVTDDDIGEVSELFNNPPAGGLLSEAKTFVAEPDPPNYWH